MKLSVNNSEERIQQRERREERGRHDGWSVGGGGSGSGGRTVTSAKRWRMRRITNLKVGKREILSGVEERKGRKHGD